METRKQNHCVYRCQYHVVIVPRYRHKVLIKGVAEYLLLKFKEVGKYYPEIEFVKVNVQEDHVHMIISFPPKYSISKVVQIIKQNSGKSIKGRFEFLQKRYWGRGGIWSEGYFVSTVGLDEHMIARYVEYQGKEDSGQAKLALW